MQHPSVSDGYDNVPRNKKEIKSMTPLEEQVAALLGLTKTLNVPDAIEHIKTLKRLLALTEEQRKEWADMCIKKQARIEELEVKIEEWINQSSTPDFIIEQAQQILNK